MFEYERLLKKHVSKDERLRRKNDQREEANKLIRDNAKLKKD